LSEEGGRYGERISLEDKGGAGGNVDAEREDDAMSLGKRHVGRRVAGVGVGVALMVLGLEAPAMAAPAVTSFTPTTGPIGCVIVLTGTGFLDVPQAQQDVVFVGPVAGPADDIVLDGANTTDDNFFARISATEMWVEVPAATSTPPANTGLALGVGYTIQVTDPTGGAASATTFTRVTGAGGCAPTITSLTPTCGAASDKVVIAGTNLIGPGLVGGETRFSPYDTARIASHVVPDVDEPTSISVVVPSGSTDGKVQVTTFTGGVAFSPTVFDISDACVPVGPVSHARAISLTLKKHLVAKGVVSSTEDPAFTDCVAGVPVKIQRKTNSGWKNVGSTTTSDTGSYKKSLKDKPGKYRAIAKKVGLGDPVTDTCTKATSPVRKHKH
jgi:IPT/TIG domain